MHVYFILFQFEASIYHHSLQLLVFLVPFHLVSTTLHQPLVHRYIKQVNPDTFWQTFDSSLLLGVTSLSLILFSGREQIIRDLGLNRIILICIAWCHFLEVAMISVAGIKLHRIRRPGISDETQLNTRSSQETSFPRWRHKGISPRSPVARPWTRTSQLQTFVVSRGFDGFTQFFF